MTTWMNKSPNNRSHRWQTAGHFLAVIVFAALRTHGLDLLFVLQLATSDFTLHPQTLHRMMETSGIVSFGF